jgi:hypothetical protein
MAYHFEVGSDLYVAGRDEDGQDYTAELYFVTATAADGTRYRHGTSFPGCSVERDCDDDGYPITCFMDIREFAIEEAQRLIDHIEQTGGKIDLLRWWPMESVYGSAAYVRNDEELDQIMRERQEA